MNEKGWETRVMYKFEYKNIFKNLNNIILQTSLLVLFMVVNIFLLVYSSKRIQNELN